MTVRDRIRFYQQLAVLARAGVPLRASLDRLQDRFSGGEMAVLVQKINAGEGIGDAFIAARFSPFECHLVVAGERSAQLETVFQHLSEFWMRQREMRDAIIRPLYYPLAVLHFALVIGAVVEAVTLSWEAALFHFLVRLALLYAIGFGLYFVVRATWSSPAAQRFWLFVPLIGGALSRAYAYRWITAMRIEYAAGIPLSSAVADAWRASGFVGGERLAREGEAALRESTNLSTLVQQWRQLPRDWIDFIETGEVSGALETSFIDLEAEAARAWAAAQQRLNEWLPKVIYFLVLLIAAAQVGLMLYQVVLAPIVNAQTTVDNLLNAK